MRISRLYLPFPLASDSEVELDERARQYVLQVLRLKSGAPLIVFNGDGNEYSATLGLAEKRRANIIVGECRHPGRESPLAVHLGLGISKGERMDYAIQKAVELGVAEITPLFSQHCVVKLDQKRIENRLRHWRAVIISASEQCGRNTLAQLHAPVDISRWIEMDSADLALILAPQAERVLTQIQPAPRQLRLTIGPEGGFSEVEIGMAISAGFSAVTLGPRILRTETAVVAGLSALQTLWGDLTAP